MPESAEQIYARVQAAVDDSGRLPLPPVHEWDMFPWEVINGVLVPKVVQAPTPGDEAPRAGAGGVDCTRCTGRGNFVDVWANDRWRLARPPHPTGLPIVLWLAAKDHLDYPDMSEDLAAEYGRLSVRLCRIMSELPNIGRVHVCRWGDGSEHLHVWFIARPSRLPHIVGSMAVEWDEMLPPVPEEVWHADIRMIAHALAEHDGVALV